MVPPITNFNRVFHYKPSILEYLYFGNTDMFPLDGEGDTTGLKMHGEKSSCQEKDVTEPWCFIFTKLSWKIQEITSHAYRRNIHYVLNYCLDFCIFLWGFNQWLGGWGGFTHSFIFKLGDDPFWLIGYFSTGNLGWFNHQLDEWSPKKNTCFPTVDGSEIPNNHLAYIKPKKKSWDNHHP